MPSIPPRRSECWRRIFCNLTTTGLTVVVALLIGTVELLQVLIHMTRRRGAFPDCIASLDMGALGYLIVAVFLLAWTLSVVVWKFGRLEQRQAALPHSHAQAIMDINSRPELKQRE